MVTQMKVALPVIKCRHSLDIERNIFPHSRLKGKLLTKKKERNLCNDLTFSITDESENFSSKVKSLGQSI